MSDLLRCNRNIRVDAETTNDGTNYPNVAVRLEYSMCNWNQNPNYKILLDNDTARFSEWHAKTDTVIDRTKRTIYEKKWTNKVLESGECISIVQNTFIDTSLGNHNLDSLIQGNAVIDGEVIVPGNNGDEFCYAYAYENISFDKGELNAIPAPSPIMSPSTSPSKVPSKTKGSTKAPTKAPTSNGVTSSPVVKPSTSPSKVPSKIYGSTKAPTKAPASNGVTSSPSESEEINSAPFPSSIMSPSKLPSKAPSKIYESTKAPTKAPTSNGAPSSPSGPEEVNSAPFPSSTMSPSKLPSKAPSKSKGALKSTKSPASKGASKSTKSPASKGVSKSTPKDPKAKHDPKVKGTDVASDIIAAAEGTDNASTTPVKTVLSVVMMIFGGALVLL